MTRARHLYVTDEDSAENVHAALHCKPPPSSGQRSSHAAPNLMLLMMVEDSSVMALAPSYKRSPARAQAAVNNYLQVQDCDDVCRVGQPGPKGHCQV